MEPHLAAADVQDVGDRAIGLVVVGQVRVQEQDRDAADLGDPHRHDQVATGQRNADLERFAIRVRGVQQRQPTDVVVRVGMLLVAVRVDRLAEVALAVQEPDPDERQGHVAGRLHVVAGEDAEAAGVDPERLVEAVLGAEVGDRAAQLGRVLAVEPVVRAVGQVAVELPDDRLVLGHEPGVVEELCVADLPFEEGHGVPVASPGHAVHPAEQDARRRMPRPPQVVREPAETLQLRRHAERDARQGGHADEGIHAAP